MCKCVLFLSGWVERLGQISHLLCSQRVEGTSFGERVRKTALQAPGKSQIIVVQKSLWSQKQNDSIRCSMSYALNTCVSEWKRCTCRRGNANILVSQCSRECILQKPSSDSRWWIYPTGMSRGQDTHAGKARSERAGLGKRRTGMEPCGTLRVWLAHGASCHPAKARWPRNCEVTQRQKCALFFLYVEVEALETRLAFIEGH